MDTAMLLMDMPERCDDCKLCYYSDGTVPICYWESKKIDETKPDWCPLKLVITDRLNRFDLINYQLTPEKIDAALKQMEVADDIFGCTVKWVIENSNNSCSGCIYEDADGSTEDIGNCVCCRRNSEFAKNDYYRKKF